jgi:hypothetical protein
MPVLRDGDSFFLVLLPVDFKALLGGILDNHLAMLRMDCVQDIEEELSIDLTSLRELRRNVSHQLFILRVMHIEILHVYFRPLRYINHGDLFKRDQLLLFGEDLSKEVFPNLVYRRKIELYYMRTLVHQ